MHAHYCGRGHLIGTESSGKTMLAAHYGMTWVPEYGRASCATKAPGPHATEWRTGEFVHSGREQNRRVDAAARQANRLPIGDTDAFATAIWHERYMAAPSAAVEAVAVEQRPDLYLWTGIAIPFVQDGTRDGEDVRPWMYRRFVDALAARRLPHAVITETRRARLRQATAAVTMRATA